MNDKPDYNNRPLPAIPASADFINALSREFKKFHATDETGFMSRIRKKVRKIFFHKTYKTIKKQLADQIKSKTDNQEIHVLLPSSEKLSGRKIALALEKLKNQSSGLKPSVGLNSLNNKLIPNDEENNKLTPNEEEIANIFEKLSKKAIETSNQHPILMSDNVEGGLRFRDVRHPVDSAVKTDLDGKEVTMPAHYVGDHYIAMQGPKSNPETMYAIYQMLLNEDSNTVVNLTNDLDVRYKKDLEVRYWPDNTKSLLYSKDGKSIKVTTKDIEENDNTGCNIITLELEKDGKKKEVKVFHFEDWIDFGAPGSEAELTKFDAFFRRLEAHPRTGKTVVHCRAGVGRTGTLIVMEQIKEKIKRNQINAGNFREEVENLILKGREERGPSFVQKPEQLKFIFDRMSKELPQPEGDSPSQPEPYYENYQVSQSEPDYVNVPASRK